MPSDLTQGDTDPPYRFNVSDQAGLVDLTTVESITFIAKQQVSTGSAAVITGTAVPINPPVTDADGNVYNGQYVWATGDTNVAGTYQAAVKVVRAGKTQVYPSGDYPPFTIKAKLA